jgi:hypothetical protein
MALPGVPQNVLDAEVDLQTTLAIAADGNVSPLSAAEAFWIQGPVDLSRWNKLFPYQLLVVRATADGNGGVTYTAEPGWQYTFPIPPEGISFGIPFAINVQPTQGGIVEEHNGAPFRIIQMRGTTGFLPGRGRAETSSTASFAGALLGGTITQLGRVAGDASRTIASATGASPTNDNLHRFREFEITDRVNGANAFVAKTTGYYQLRRLEAFLEAYVAEKKRRRGNDLRLALAIWKKEAVYLVTPGSFDYSKTGEGGGEEPFSLTFKAWRRVRLESGGFRPVLPAPVRRDPSALARGLNTLVNARRTLQSLSKVPAAAIGDVVRDVFEPLRQATLLTKDALGAAQSVAELPDALARSCRDAYIQLKGDAASVRDAATLLKDDVKRDVKLAQAAAREVQDLTSKRSSTQPGGTATRARQRALQSHPASAPFEDPRSSFDLLSGVSVAQLQLPPAIRRQIEAEATRVRTLRRRDFELMRDQVRRSADRLAIALGAGNAMFEDQYSINNVHPIKSEPTDSDWEALFALNESCIYLDQLAATADGEPSAQEERMVVMAALARASGIAFKVPRSKFAVPFPYGGTLEQLAKQYLGDPLRWHEIAALNGLREPYVDEVGFDLQLRVNGDDHQVVVADATNLYVGQTVYVWSDQVRRTRRQVQGLRRVGADTVVTLNGDPDMGLYRTEDRARLSAFLPDTVNSQQLVYIPSDTEPVDDDAITKAIPGVNEFDPMVATVGVDLLLDSTNDLVIGPDGDTRFAAGLANLLQYVRVALSVPRGHLMLHPEFGLPVVVGMSTADFDPGSVLTSVRRMFAEDPSIATVNGVKIEKKGPTASITASIVAAGTDQPVPLRFEIDPDFGAPGVSA